MAKVRKKQNEDYIDRLLARHRRHVSHFILGPGGILVPIKDNLDKNLRDVREAYNDSMRDLQELTEQEDIEPVFDSAYSGIEE